MLRGLRHLCTSRRGIRTAPPPPPPPSRLLLLHNPRCSKSRAALALLQEHAPRCGARLDVREYLKQPLSAADLGALVRMLGCDSPWDICREAEARALGFRRHAAAAPGASDDDAGGDAGLLEAMVRNPALLQRPLLVCMGSQSAVLGRPPERVLELLPPLADVEAVAAAAAEEEEARSPRWRADSAGSPLPPPPPPSLASSSSTSSSSASWVPPALPQSGAPAWEVRGEGEGGWSPPARATAPAQEEAGAGAETQRARQRPAQYREFVPSDSWAEVEGDHICPGGCEYRIDMDTGVKLARWAR